MEKELTKAQLTFVDLYDSYTLSLSSDVIAVPCDAEGEALSTKTYTIDYQVRAGESVIKSICESATLSTTIPNVTVDKSTVGQISVEVKTTAKIPEDSGIYIKIKTNDGNDFIFERFISFMNIKKGQDGESGRGISSIVEEYEINDDPKHAPTSGWSAAIKNPTADNKYLWNRELITYNKKDGEGNTQSYTSARIISVYGKDGDPGRGIESIVEYYAASDNGKTSGKPQIIGGGGTVSVEQYEKYAQDGAVDDISFDSNTRYYTFNMNQQNRAYNIVKLTFDIKETTDIIISCINDGESVWDYMRVSHISTNSNAYKFTASYNKADDTHPDNASTYYCFASQHGSQPVDVTFYNITPGVYYVYIKVQKDTSSHYNDIYKFKCDEISTSWQTTIPADYGPDYPYLWNYTCFNYTDGGISASDPQVISHWGLDAFALKVATDKGDVFTDGIEEITLSLEAYSGENKINTQVPYEWSYYTFDGDDGDNWTTLTSGKANIEDISLTVKISDPYAYSMFKCEIRYNGVSYSDYETLKQDVQDVYYAETRILDDDLDGNCVVLCTDLVKNGKTVDPLLTERVEFVRNLRASDNSDSSGYFYTDELGKNFISGSHTAGDFVYLVTYRSIFYLQSMDSVDQGDGEVDQEEFVYNNNCMYDAKSNASGVPYKTGTLSNAYHLILARYDGECWRPYNAYDAYEYCYINNSADHLLNFTFNNAKVVVVDKRYLSQSQSLHVDIHTKVYDESKTFKYYVPYIGFATDTSTYDIWKIYNYYVGEDTRVFSFSSTTFQAIKMSYAEEHFRYDSTGVYVSHRITEFDTSGESIQKEPFFVKITSERMGFWSQEYDSNNLPVQGGPVEMVYIGNNSTSIRNSILEGGTTVQGAATFNSDVIISKAEATNGFAVHMETDGSLSLILS